MPDLQYEGRMYQRLKRLRGKVVPVYLVSKELIDSWWNTGVGIVHMLLIHISYE
jgi:hypothetical protein